MNIQFFFCAINEKWYGFIKYKGKVVTIHYCLYGENGKDEIVEFELIKTDTGYEFKNKPSTEEAIKLLFFV